MPILIHTALLRSTGPSLGGIASLITPSSSPKRTIFLQDLPFKLPVCQNNMGARRRTDNYVCHFSAVKFQEVLKEQID